MRFSVFKNLLFLIKSQGKKRLKKTLEPVLKEYEFEENVNQIKKNKQIADQIIKTQFEVIDKLCENEKDLEVTFLFF